MKRILCCSSKVLLFVSVFIVMLFFSGCRNFKEVTKPSIVKPQSSLLVLDNGKILLGLLPEVGGHVVLLRSPDGQNILKSDPKMWTETPPVSVEKPVFLPYNGHIYWLGPQGEWWSQQDVNPEKKRKKANWPPDPLLTLAKYKVIEKTDTSVKLQSPPSSVSGIQFVKEFSIKDNKVFLKVTATNIRESEVSWDIWSNTRLPGKAKVYVPVTKEEGSIWIEYKSCTMEKDRILPYEITDNFLHFDLEYVKKDKKHVFTSKTFIVPAEPFIAAFCNNYLFLKKANQGVVEKKKLHSKHAFVEIFKFVGTAPDPLTELEMHGAYKTLKPGENMSFSETWELIPAPELKTSEERINFIKEKMK